MITITKLFLCFLFFSFIGWCMEVTLGIIENKKFVNRGFLIGPICPIYGTGCVLIVLLLNRYTNDPIVLFFMSMAICSVLEYFTSYLMEKIFKARWWDYSNMKYNINGRICLETLIPFGVLGSLVLYVAYPLFNKLVSLMNSTTLYIISGILLILLLIDFGMSLNIVIKFKNTAFKIAKDSTEEITKFVKETFAKNSALTRRLIESFPNFKLNINFIINKLNKLKIKNTKKK